MKCEMANKTHTPQSHQNALKVLQRQPVSSDVAHGFLHHPCRTSHNNNDTHRRGTHGAVFHHQCVHRSAASNRTPEAHREHVGTTRFPLPTATRPGVKVSHPLRSIPPRKLKVQSERHSDAGCWRRRFAGSHATPIDELDRPSRKTFVCKLIVSKPLGFAQVFYP